MNNTYSNPVENVNEVFNNQNSSNMKEQNDVVATPNVIESTKAAETASNNNIRNNIDMNNIIDFSSVCGEGIVAQTASVDQQVVNDMFNAFLSIPQEVIVKFKNENGYLKMVVYMNHREKFLRSYETFADAKLVEIMVGSMRGDKVGALQGYKSEEHPLKASEVDPRINIFSQFINSPLRCHFDNDFIATNGDRYVCVTFNISYRKYIKFCLKRTEEIEIIINKAIHAA